MNYSNKPIVIFISALVFFSTPLTTTAQEERPREERATSVDEMVAIVEKGLPNLISDNNADLVEALLSPRLGKSFNDAFDVDFVAKKLFVNGEPESQRCDETKRVCEFVDGDASGQGEYSKLSVLEGPAAMSVRFVHRPKESDKVVSTKLSDKSAYDIASTLLTDTLGVPSEEIPIAPSSALYPLPVKTVNLAFSNGEGENKTMPVEKLVKIQRGLYVGGNLGWVPGPGKMSVVLNEAGVSSAVVRGWADMSRYGEGLSSRNAKSRSQLVEELVTRFQKEGILRLHSARSLLAVGLPEGASAPVPVLRVFASAQPRDLEETSQASVVSSAGVVFDIPLIALKDDNVNQEQSD